MVLSKGQTRDKLTPEWIKNADGTLTYDSSMESPEAWGNRNAAIAEFEQKQWDEEQRRATWPARRDAAKAKAKKESDLSWRAHHALGPTTNAQQQNWLKNRKPGQDWTSYASEQLAKPDSRGYEYTPQGQAAAAAQQQAPQQQGWQQYGQQAPQSMAQQYGWGQMGGQQQAMPQWGQPQQQQQMPQWGQPPPQQMPQWQPQQSSQQQQWAMQPWGGAPPQQAMPQWGNFMGQQQMAGPMAGMEAARMGGGAMQQMGGSPWASMWGDPFAGRQMTTDPSSQAMGGAPQMDAATQLLMQMQGMMGGGGLSGGSSGGGGASGGGEGAYQTPPSGGRGVGQQGVADAPAASNNYDSLASILALFAGGGYGGGGGGGGYSAPDAMYGGLPRNGLYYADLMRGAGG